MCCLFVCLYGTILTCSIVPKSLEEFLVKHSRTVLFRKACFYDGLMICAVTVFARQHYTG